MLACPLRGLRLCFVSFACPLRGLYCFFILACPLRGLDRLIRVLDSVERQEGPSVPAVLTNSQGIHPFNWPNVPVRLFS